MGSEQGEEAGVVVKICSERGTDIEPCRTGCGGVGPFVGSEIPQQN